MNSTVCPREAEVLDAIFTGRWPETCDRELRAHVAACGPCGEAAQLAGALRAERAAEWQRAVVPSSGLAWWRAELRARQERAARVEQPIALVHLLAIAVCLMAAVAAGAAAATPVARVAEWIVWLAGWAPSLVDRIGGGGPFLRTAVLVSFGVWLILASVVVYLVVERD